MGVLNDTEARQALNTQHQAVAQTLRELAMSLQAINGDWSGPAKDGFSTFQKIFSKWCEDGATYFEAMGKKHLKIDNAYQDASRQATTSIDSSAVTG